MELGTRPRNLSSSVESPLGSSVYHEPAWLATLQVIAVAIKVAGRSDSGMTMSLLPRLELPRRDRIRTDSGLLD